MSEMRRLLSQLVNHSLLCDRLISLHKYVVLEFHTSAVCNCVVAADSKPVLEIMVTKPTN